MQFHGHRHVCAKGPGARHVDVDFTRDLEASPPEEWRLEIDQTLFPGGYFKEFIFFHKASKTLILADTIINIELDKITEPWRTACRCDLRGKDPRRLCLILADRVAKVVLRP